MTLPPEPTPPVKGCLNASPVKKTPPKKKAPEKVKAAKKAAAKKKK